MRLGIQQPMTRFPLLVKRGQTVTNHVADLRPTAKNSGAASTRMGLDRDWQNEYLRGFLFAVVVPIDPPVASRRCGQ